MAILGNLDTKERIHKALRELAKNTPIDKITVKQIAQQAGITTQTFYNHFPDKYELAAWAYKKRIENLFERKNKEELTWGEVLHLLIRGYKNNDKFIMNAFRNTHGEDSYLLKSAEYLCESIEKDMTAKNNGNELPLEIRMLIKLYVGGIINVIALWVSGFEELTEDDMVSILADGVPEKLKEFYIKINK